jgi:hypothetical protein
MDRRHKPSRHAEGRYQISLRLTAGEFEAVRRAARAEGLNDAAYLRRCINGALLDVGDEGVLLQERACPIYWRARDLAQVWHWRQAGVTIRQIAQRTGHSSSSIFRALARKRMETADGHP